MSGYPPTGAQYIPHGQNMMAQGPQITMAGNHQSNMPYDKSLVMIHSVLRTEKKEIGGVQVEMPKASMNSLQKYEEVIQNWKPEDKVSFLEGTILKRKALPKQITYEGTYRVKQQYKRSLDEGEIKDEWIKKALKLKKWRQKNGIAKAKSTLDLSTA
mmetsp:Transcript_11646/g.8504  ORF Transcript_11646/g.8504 Transcript_11646/m.8504 type:complete len:157 (+) Transcript_11646:359-829(+)